MRVEENGTTYYVVKRGNAIYRRTFEQLNHGTLESYFGYGCRCATCSATGRQWRMAHKKR